MNEPTQSRITNRRTAMGLTTEELALCAKVSETTIINYETGTITRADINVLRRIAQTLGLGVGEIWSVKEA